MSLPRFSIIPAAAVTDARLDPRDLQVLCLLGRHTDDLGWCCRSQVRMARELNCGRATVQRSLGRLADAGYLEIRPNNRASGADAAHDYRVVIDPPVIAGAEALGVDAADLDEGGAESAAIAEADLDVGVPAGEQGVPIDGQGVPTHERAPMLTTPDKRSERERARDDGKASDGRTLQTFRMAWRTAGVDSREKTERAWMALSPVERTEALNHVAAWQAEFAVHGRGKNPAGWTYLADKPWELAKAKAEAAPAAVAVPAKPTIAPFTRAWWWFLHRLLAAGSISRFKRVVSLNATVLLGADERLPTEAEEAAMVRLDRDGEGFKAWTARAWKAHGVSLPRPASSPYVWAPSEWPPTVGMDAVLEEQEEAF